jgi:hypothetical protein
MFCAEGGHVQVILIFAPIQSRFTKWSWHTRQFGVTEQFEMYLHPYGYERSLDLLHSCSPETQQVLAELAARQYAVMGKGRKNGGGMAAS